MVAKKSVDYQLRSLRLRFRLFGRAEIKELHRILSPGESIQHCVYGFYQGGSAILVATNDRLLLIDKRPFFVNLEDMKYGVIKEVDYTQRLLQGTLYLHAGLKRLTFRSISDARLKRAKQYIHQRVTKAREEGLIGAETLVKKAIKPYLNPAWRPHHTSFIRRRPAKFYGAPSQPTSVK